MDKVLLDQMLKFAAEAYKTPSLQDKKIKMAVEVGGKTRMFKVPKYLYYDSKYKFAEFYDNSTGYTLTTDVLDFQTDENGKVTAVQTGKDPASRSFPELIDVGIMSGCKMSQQCAVGCYQGAKAYNPKTDMSLDTYKHIIDEVKDRCYSVALGGAGNPDDHEHFEEIVDYTVKNGMVASYTTSFFDEAKAVKAKQCSAIAISWHPTKVEDGWDWTKPQDYTVSSIACAVEHGFKTNIHFVLSKESIKTAIKLLSDDSFREQYAHGVNAIIFLRYKAVGCAKKENCLVDGDADVESFFKLIDDWQPSKHGNLKIGFDSCCVPLISKNCKKVPDTCLISCEALSRSMYIAPDGRNLACSFANQTPSEYFTGTVEEFWNSEKAEQIRKNKCVKECPFITGEKIG